MNIVTFPHEIYFYGDDERLSSELDLLIQQAKNPRLHSRSFSKAWLTIISPKMSAWFYDDGTFFHIVDKAACPTWHHAITVIDAAADNTNP